MAYRAVLRKNALGAAFDSLNFRKIPGPGSTGVAGVLSDQQDRANANFVADEVSGYNVNTIALQVPIALLTARVLPCASANSSR